MLSNITPMDMTASTIITVNGTIHTTDHSNISETHCWEVSPRCIFTSAQHTPTHMLWLLFVLLHMVAAHVPVTDDNLLHQDVVGKSWGVYRHLCKGEHMPLRLNVDKGETLSFSVNLLGSMSFVPGVQYVNVTLLGHNTTDIDHTEGFTGWGRRLDAKLDKMRVFPVDTADNGFHYEPFGVGLYRSLVAFNGTAVVGDVFNLTVTALEDVRLSVGVGMAESFSLYDFYSMSPAIAATWELDGWSPVWGVFSILFAVCILTLVQREDQHERYGVRAVLLFSALQFCARLLQVAAYGGPLAYDALWLTLGVHVILPFLVFAGLPWMYHKTALWTRFAMVVYSFFLLWQGYHLVVCGYLVLWTWYHAKKDVHCHPFTALGTALLLALFATEWSLYVPGNAALLLLLSTAQGWVNDFVLPCMLITVWLVWMFAAPWQVLVTLFVIDILVFAPVQRVHNPTTNTTPNTTPKYLQQMRVL